MQEVEQGWPFVKSLVVHEGNCALYIAVQEEEKEIIG